MSNTPELEIVYNLDRVVTFLKEFGGKASKTRIMRTLSIPENKIWDILNYGNDVKCIRIDLGNSIVFRKDYNILEESFYPAVKTGIESLWRSEDFDPSEFYVEKTARTNSKIAGPWTRPDFTMISHKKFPWTIGREFDVVTFEVKRPDSCNVLAVFEALSHSTTATRAYVVFPVDASVWSKSDPEQEARVKDECSKHGVGLILIENVYAEPRPLHLIKARKKELDHDKTSKFLDAVMTAEGKQKISTWK